jgi:hypothetical protein
MANPNEDERIRAAVKQMSKVPLKELSLEHVSSEQRYGLVSCLRELDPALRAYYNQHQANGCECELCKNAELALANFSEEDKKNMTTPNQIQHALVLKVRQQDPALRAYYNQHQANGCECELCKNAELALASEAFIK